MLFMAPAFNFKKFEELAGAKINTLHDLLKVFDVYNICQFGFVFKVSEVQLKKLYKLANIKILDEESLVSIVLSIQELRELLLRGSGIPEISEILDSIYSDLTVRGIDLKLMKTKTPNGTIFNKS